MLALMAATALLVSVIWSPSMLPHIPICPLQRWADVPCPGCGLTRAFCAISHGQFKAAYGYNPFGYVFYLAAIVLVTWPAVVRARPSLQSSLGRWKWLPVLIPVLIGAMYAWGIARIIRLRP